MENQGRKIKKATIIELIAQNSAMRKLLEDWPSREIMMDYEKEWNENRQEFFQKHEPVDFKMP